MKLLVFVLNNVTLQERFLVQLKERGIKGATIINSTGMGRMLANNEDRDIIGSLKFLFDNPRAESRTFLMALEEEQIETVFQIIDEVVGDLSLPNSGIVFTLPIDRIKGYKK
jgi:nitrogen regulatory protein PII